MNFEEIEYTELERQMRSGSKKSSKRGLPPPLVLGS
jgi:hypothetical protein